MPDCLSRIEIINPKLNAIVALADDAIDAAKRAEAALPEFPPPAIALDRTT